MDSRQAPLYEIKANLFRALAHPVRIRVLELLTSAGGARSAGAPSEGAPPGGGGASPSGTEANSSPGTGPEVTVAELLADLDISPSHLSGHLAVLKRHGVVTSRRAGSHVYYRTAHPAVLDLLAAARTFLLDSLAQGSDQLAAATDLPELGPAAGAR